MWTEVGIATSAALALAAAAKTLVVDTVLKTRTDRQTLDTAKAQHPKIMEQLEAGNFKSAAEGIAIAQGLMAEQLQRAREEIDQLRRREQGLEAESEGWERRARAAELRADSAVRRAARLEGLYARLESRCSDLEREVVDLRTRVDSDDDALGDPPQ